MSQLEALGEASALGRAARAAPRVQRREIRPYVLLAVKELSGIPEGRGTGVAGADRYACVRAIVRRFARARSTVDRAWSADDVKTYLEGLRFTPECVEELASLLCTEGLYAELPAHRRARPRLAALRWRIDLSLCQVTLAGDSADEARNKRLLHRDTFVVLVFALTDGTTRAYRVGVRKFHEVRFAVASALKSMLVLESRKCMRRDARS